MKVEIHKLFEYLLETTESKPEAFLGFSLSDSPRLKDFLGELEPDTSLDWSGESFQGLFSLRENILESSNLVQVCSLDDVLVTAGTAEANYLAIMQLLQPGDEIVVEGPGWPQPVVLANAIGARIKTLYRKEANDWLFDVSELESLITTKTRLIFLTNPNNPTGQVLGEKDLETITQLAEKAGAYVIVDEVYAGLEWQGKRAPSVAGIYDRGITTNSVSKALGLQGLRTGWLICKDKSVIKDAYILRENSSEIMNVMGEKIAEIALRKDRYEEAISKARAEGRANLSLLNEFINARPELSWQSPKAGLIGMCHVDLTIDGETLAKQLLEPPYKTFLLPGSAYDLPQHIRLGVGGGEAAGLELGLERLGMFLDNYSGG